MHRFKDLEIWKRSRLFCSEIYSTTSNFPDSEKFGLTNQLRRSSVSIPSNIAEGSCYEIETQLLIAFDLKFISFEELNLLSKELEEIVK